MNPLHSVSMALSVALICAGCAHPITIAPDMAKLAPVDVSARIDKAVGYFIPEDKKALQVTTPAGGGDSVKYSPYADLEPGFSRVLSNVFSAAYPIKDMKDQAFLQSNNISWVFTPTITTTSSSRNNFFWPPTDFSVTIDCVATDAGQRPVWNNTVTANGDLIAVKEVIKDHGLAGKSAAEKALGQLQGLLLSSPEFRSK